MYPEAASSLPPLNRSGLSSSPLTLSTFATILRKISINTIGIIHKIFLLLHLDTIMERKDTHNESYF